MLADQLRPGNQTALTGYERYVRSHDERPLLTAIDRWGHTPLVSVAISAHAVADIVTAHLGGTAPAHVAPAAQSPVGTTMEPHSLTEASQPASAIEDLDPGSYERGIAARGAAHRHLRSLTSVLDDVEDRADALLAALGDLLYDEPPHQW